MLAREGRARLRIVLDSAKAIPSEKTAAQELSSYLGQSAGATFEVLAEKDLPKETPAIYLGDTHFARANGIEPEKLGAEESVIRTMDASLIITGGRPRGTLYGVYEFLENVLGCRWYTPWAEHVPSRPDCVVPLLDTRVCPFFIYRDHYTHLGDPRLFPDNKAWTWFNVRNRMNGPGIGKLTDEVGGSVKCGGRAANHSFAVYIPAEKYFKDHPEYFSERKGKRVPSNGVDGNQLCLTNPDALRIVIEEVRKDIKARPDGLYYSVSINDGGNRTLCDCAPCRAVAEKEGESGLLLQFVNAVADAIKVEHPDKYILTLAYNPTALPPKRIRARDNVIIYLCRGLRSAAVYLPKGTDSREMQSLSDWSKHARHIWGWDYACWGAKGMNYFRPIIWKVDEQFKLAKQLGCLDGIFVENELLACEDSMFMQFYEMDVWVMAKLMQDPSRDISALIADFLNGYYGAAGPILQQYVELIRERLPRYPYRMFDYAFIRKSQECFDRAEAAVKDAPELLGRVKDLRIGLDLAALAYRSNVIRDYLRAGERLEDYPYGVPLLKDRILRTLDQTRHPYLLAKTHRHDKGQGRRLIPVREIARQYTLALCEGKEYAPLPEPFQSLPPDRVIDLLAPQLANRYSPMFVPDPGAALGLAISRMNADELPLPIGVYSLSASAGLGGTQVRAEDIPGAGYHLYKGPRFTPDEWCYVWLTKSWQVQEQLFTLFNPERSEAQWDVYVSAKFTGPAYPHSDPNHPNALYIDRMILVSVDVDSPRTP